MASEPMHDLRMLSDLFQRAFGLDCTNDVQLLKGYSYCLWIIKKATRESKSYSEIAENWSATLSAEAANELCQWLVSFSFDSNFFAFFDFVSPFIIADRTVFLTFFSAPIRPLSLVKYMVLTIAFSEQAGDSPLPFSPDKYEKLKSFFAENSMSISFDYERFSPFWTALHGTPLFKTDIKIRGNLNTAMRLYKKYNLPFRKLLDDYAIVLRFQDELETAINPWAYVNKALGREKEQGLSVEETLFEEAAYKLKKEHPTDVIRALFYGGNRNDSAFECSFLLEQFVKLLNDHPSSSDILIVNPCPDFLLSFHERSKDTSRSFCFAVRDDVTASLYEIQFSSRFRFIPFSSIPTLKNVDRLLIMTRDSVDEELSQLLKSLETCSPNARVLALLPSKTYDSGRSDFRRILSSNRLSIDRVLIVSTDATKSFPRKKSLFFLSSDLESHDDLQSACIPVFTSFCTEDDHFCVTRDHTLLDPEAFYSRSDPLLTLFNRALKEKQKTKDTAERARRHPPEEYHFSKEISIWYTLSENRKARFAAKAYYCETLSGKSKRRRGKILTPMLERGLRAESRDKVISALENVAFEPEFSPVIVQDILGHYSLESPLSLKTIWFCLRQCLMANPRYNDSCAREMFCGDCQALSELIALQSYEDDYQQAMEALQLSDSISVQLKYWRQLELIVTTAVKEHYIRSNPLFSLMQSLSSRATVEQREVRNALVKKTFTYEEELKMLAFVRSSSDGTTARYITQSKWLAGVIRLFTGMSGSEVSALNWKDYSKIDALGVYQFRIMPNPNERNQSETASADKIRLVPVAPLLARMMNDRLDYLIHTYGVDMSTMKDYPVVFVQEVKDSVLPEPKALRCSSRRLAGFSREFANKADIPEHILVLPINDDSGVETDISKYEGDIFRAHFRYRANHSCSMTRGEVSYILGNTPLDTFSKHYCDYTNDLIQYGMIRKLDRWTSVFEKKTAALFYFHRLSWHSGVNDAIVAAPPGSGLVADVNSTIVVDSDNSTDDHFEFEISSPGGISGSISVIHTDGGDGPW